MIRWTAAHSKTLPLDAGRIAGTDVPGGHGTITRTIEQQIAEAEARLARLRNQSRQLGNGQKIILGGMLLTAARHDPKIRAWVLKEAEIAVTRDIDKKRLQPLLEELKTMKDSRPEATAVSSSQG